jgi:hypothetical protein
LQIIDLYATLRCMSRHDEARKSVAPTLPREGASGVRRILTDRFINSRKNASPGRRDDYPDVIVPGLGLRVTDRGHKSFVLVTRYPSNPAHPTRRALGEVGAISLEQARQKARGWLELIGRGIDPGSRKPVSVPMHSGDS